MLGNTGDLLLFLGMSSFPAYLCTFMSEPSFDLDFEQNLSDSGIYSHPFLWGEIKWETVFLVKFYHYIHICKCVYKNKS